LRQAVREEQWSLAVELVEHHARSLMVSAPLELLRPAVLQIPLEVAAKSVTVLALRDVWLRVPDHMLLSAARLPTTADALKELGKQDRAVRVVYAGLWLIIALRVRGWFDEARDYADRLLRVLDAVRAVRPTDVAEIYPALHLQAAIARMLVGDHTGALGALREAYLWAADNPHEYIESDAASKTALVYGLLGDHERAEKWLEWHRAAPLRESHLRLHIRSTADAADLLIAVDRLDLARARTAAAQLLTTDGHRDLFRGFFAYAHAQHALVTGTFRDGLDHLRRARALYRDSLGHGAVAGPMLAAAEADLLLALGRGNHAHSLVSGEHAKHPLLQVSRARIALLTGEPKEALRMATDTAWDRRATSRARLEMMLIHAIAANRTEDRRSAVAALKHAIDAARLSGALRAFRTVPRHELDELASDLPEAADLLAEPALAGQPQIFPASVPLITLTPREQQVLERLAGGQARHEIASSLHVSVNTVKVQLRTLYRKLGVDSRPDALARGREYGLLP
jgi:LuxR family maltose regulon positive regulatory protein